MRREDDSPGDGERCESGPVGYGRPPRSTRFKPGRPRQRGGRRRGTENRKTIVKRVALEAHGVMENGKRRRRSALELVLLFLRNCAAEGSVRGFRAYHDCLTRFEPQNPKREAGYLLITEEPATIEEWEKLAEMVMARQKTLTWDSSSDP